MIVLYNTYLVMLTSEELRQCIASNSRKLPGHFSYHQEMRLAFTVSHCSNCIRIHRDRNCIQSVSIRLVHMIFPVAENRALLFVEATDHYFSENKQKLLKQKLLCRAHQ